MPEKDYLKYLQPEEDVAISYDQTFEPTSNTKQGKEYREYLAGQLGQISAATPMEENVGLMFEPYGGIKNIDRKLTEADLDNIPEARAQAQSGWGLLGRALGQGLTEATLGTVEGIGYVLDFEELFNADQQATEGFDNWFSQGIRQAKEYVQEEAFPVYQTQRAMEGSLWSKLGDGTFWAAQGKTIGTTLSLLAPSTGVAKGVGILGKGLGVSKAAGNVLQGVSAAMFSRKAESAMEANQAFQQEYQKYLQEGLSDQEARVKAGESAASVFKANAKMLPLDIAQYSLALKSFSSLKKGIESFKLTKAGNILEKGFQVGSEAAEEAYQFIAQEEAIRKVREGITPFGEGFGNRLADYVEDPEFQTSAFLGGLMGGVFGAFGPVARKIAAVNDDITAKKLSATNLGDIDSFNKIDNKLQGRLITKALVSDRLELVKQNLNDLEAQLSEESNTPEEIAEIKSKINTFRNNINYVQQADETLRKSDPKYAENPSVRKEYALLKFEDKLNTERINELNSQESKLLDNLIDDRDNAVYKHRQAEQLQNFISTIKSKRVGKKKQALKNEYLDYYQKELDALNETVNDLTDSIKEKYPDFDVTKYSTPNVEQLVQVSDKIRTAEAYRDTELRPQMAEFERLSKEQADNKEQEIQNNIQENTQELIKETEKADRAETKRISDEATQEIRTKLDNTDDITSLQGMILEVEQSTTMTKPNKKLATAQIQAKIRLKEAEQAKLNKYYYRREGKPIQLENEYYKEEDRDLRHFKKIIDKSSPELFLDNYNSEVNKSLQIIENAKKYLQKDNLTLDERRAIGYILRRENKKISILNGAFITKSQEIDSTKIVGILPEKSQTTITQERKKEVEEAFFNSFVELQDAEGLTFTIRNKNYFNLYSDPTSALNRDSNGNIVSVTLHNETMSPVTFTESKIVDEVSYYILLNEMSKRQPIVETIDYEEVNKRIEEANKLREIKLKEESLRLLEEALGLKNELETFINSSTKTYKDLKFSYQDIDNDPEIKEAKLKLYEIKKIIKKLENSNKTSEITNKKLETPKKTLKNKKDERKVKKPIQETTPRITEPINKPSTEGTGEDVRSITQEELIEQIDNKLSKGVEDISPELIAELQNKELTIEEEIAQGEIEFTIGEETEEDTQAETYEELTEEPVEYDIDRKQEGREDKLEESEDKLAESEFKTPYVNIAYLAIDYDEKAGTIRSKLDANKRLVFNKEEHSLPSLPTEYNEGTKIVMYVYEGHDEYTKNQYEVYKDDVDNIPIAIQTQEDYNAGKQPFLFVHKMNWITSQRVAEHAIEQVTEETKVLREFVVNSKSPVLNFINDKSGGWINKPPKGTKNPNQYTLREIIGDDTRPVIGFGDKLGNLTVNINAENANNVVPGIPYLVLPRANNTNFAIWLKQEPIKNNPNLGKYTNTVTKIFEEYVKNNIDIKSIQELREEIGKYFHVNTDKISNDQLLENEKKDYIFRISENDKGQPRITLFTSQGLQDYYYIQNKKGEWNWIASKKGKTTTIKDMSKTLSNTIPNKYPNITKKGVEEGSNFEVYEVQDGNLVKVKKDYIDFLSENRVVTSTVQPRVINSVRTYFSQPNIRINTDINKMEVLKPAEEKVTEDLEITEKIPTFEELFPEGLPDDINIDEIFSEQDKQDADNIMKHCKRTSSSPSKNKKVRTVKK